MKYKVGDKVIIKSLQEIKKLSIDNDFEDLLFDFDVFVIDEMGKFCTKIMTISEISLPEHLEDKNITIYYLKEDEHAYSWYEDWFFPATTAGKVLFENKNAKT